MSIRSKFPGVLKLATLAITLQIISTAAVAVNVLITALKFKR